MIAGTATRRRGCFYARVIKAWEICERHLLLLGDPKSLVSQHCTHIPRRQNLTAGLVSARAEGYLYSCEVVFRFRSQADTSCSCLWDSGYQGCERARNRGDLQRHLGRDRALHPLAW